MYGHIQCNKHTRQFPELGIRIEYFRRTKGRKIHMTVSLWTIRIYLFI